MGTVSGREWRCGAEGQRLEGRREGASGRGPGEGPCPPCSSANPGQGRACFEEAEHLWPLGEGGSGKRRERGRTDASSDGGSTAWHAHTLTYSRQTRSRENPNSPSLPFSSLARLRNGKDRKVVFFHPFALWKYVSGGHQS